MARTSCLILKRPHPDGRVLERGDKSVISGRRKQTCALKEAALSADKSETSQDC